MNSNNHINDSLKLNNNSKILKLYEDLPYSSIYTDEIVNHPNNILITEYYDPISPYFNTYQAGKKLVFPIGDFHFLKNMMIRTKLETTLNNNNRKSFLGVHLFKRIRVMQKGLEIARISPSYIYSRIMSLPYNLQQYYSTLTSGEDFDFDINTEMYFITPLFFWFLEKEIHNILLYFHRDLTLECEFNDITFAGNVTFQSQLVLVKRSYEMSFIEKYIKDVYYNQDQVNPSDLHHRNYLIYNTYNISKDVGNSSRTEVILDQNYFLHSIHVCIFKDKLNPELLQINKMEIYLADKLIITLNKDVSQLSLINDLSNDTIIAANNAQGSLSYYFGSKDRMINGIKGGLDIAKGPYRVIVYHVNPGLVTDFKLNIDLEYFNILSSDNNTGLFYGYEIH
ncbi:MAG: hypothetical protein KFKLKKLM_02642 [Flavobacteriales bacterium]|nr:hypothetical protein [Flavobacteriales bacterium]